METRFYLCRHCGNLLIPLIDAGVTPHCCGEKMQELKAGETDAALEKHVPVIERDDDGKHVDISVGAAAHPMTDEHNIPVIVLVYDNRKYVFNLSPGDEPKARCPVKDNSVPLKAYAYCNLHGLWSAEV